MEKRMFVAVALGVLIFAVAFTARPDRGNDYTRLQPAEDLCPKPKQVSADVSVSYSLDEYAPDSMGGSIDLWGADGLFTLIRLYGLSLGVSIYNSAHSGLNVNEGAILVTLTNECIAHHHDSSDDLVTPCLDSLDSQCYTYCHVAPLNDGSFCEGKMGVSPVDTASVVIGANGICDVSRHCAGLCSCNGPFAPSVTTGPSTLSSNTPESSELSSGWIEELRRILDSFGW